MIYLNLFAQQFREHLLFAGIASNLGPARKRGRRIFDKTAELLFGISVVVSGFATSSLGTTWDAELETSIAMSEPVRLRSDKHSQRIRFLPVFSFRRCSISFLEPVI